MDYLIAKGANTFDLETIAAQDAMRTINDSPPCEGSYQTTITPEPQVRLDTLLADLDAPARMARTSYTFHLGSVVVLMQTRVVLSIITRPERLVNAASHALF